MEKGKTYYSMKGAVGGPMVSGQTIEKALERAPSGLLQICSSALEALELLGQEATLVVRM
jgi:hypothetical protein